MSVAASTAASSFLSTPSARRATLPRASRAAGRRDFYPRPPRGGRRRKSRSNPWWSIFLSTPSARRATRFSLCFLISTSNFYPRPPRGGRRTSRTEHRQYKQFLSTPSARRATRCLLGATPRYAISIHALREEGDKSSVKGWLRATISIHALREEGDKISLGWYSLLGRFLSTPSARRATGWGAGLRRLRADFYPRPPRGGRPETKHLQELSGAFLSTPSARRATICSTC